MIGTTMMTSRSSWIRTRGAGQMMALAGLLRARSGTPLAATSSANTGGGFSPLRDSRLIVVVEAGAL
jgi:hypothetical protein